MAAVRDHADPSRGRHRMNGFRKAELPQLFICFVGPSATPTQSADQTFLSRSPDLRVWRLACETIRLYRGTSMHVYIDIYQLLSGSASMHCRVHPYSPSPSYIGRYLLN